jgi:hypothetical protein
METTGNSSSPKSNKTNHLPSQPASQQQQQQRERKQHQAPKTEREGERTKKQGTTRKETTMEQTNKPTNTQGGFVVFLSSFFLWVAPCSPPPLVVLWAAMLRYRPQNPQGQVDGTAPRASSMLVRDGLGLFVLLFFSNLLLLAAAAPRACFVFFLFFHSRSLSL